MVNKVLDIEQVSFTGKSNGGGVYQENCSEVPVALDEDTPSECGQLYLKALVYKRQV